MRTSVHTQKKITAVLSLVFCLSTLLATPKAFSQKLEEIIVTAQKRAESLQDVSVSVTALSGDKLNDFGIARLEEITAYVPNFVMSETGIGTTIYIRGIGSGINQGFEQSVGMYRDGIYYGRAQLARAPIFDMERVEVLRGPQVTLFGNNSIGGAVSMTASKPTDALEGFVAHMSDFDHGEGETTAVLSGPLSEELSARLSIRKYELGGYIFNGTTNRDEPQRDYLTSRLNFSFKPNNLDFFDANLLLEKSTFDVKGRQIVIFQDSDARGATATSNYYQKVNPAGQNLSDILSSLDSSNGQTVIDSSRLDTRYANDDSSINETNSGVLTLNFDIGDAEFKSITGYLDYNYNDVCDCDFSGATLIRYESDEDYKQTSQEFRYTSNAGDFIEVIAGLYYQKDDLLFNDALVTEPDSALSDLLNIIQPSPEITAALTDIAGPRTFNQDTEMYSGFGQLTINLREDFRVMAGLRRSNTKKSASRELTLTQSDRITGLESNIDYSSPANGIDEADNEQYFTTIRNSLNFALNVSPHSQSGLRDVWKTSYSLILEWDISEDMLGYASRVRGFKSGGYDVRSNNPTEKKFVINNQREYISNPEVTAPTAFVPGSFEFDDEESVAHEIGIKTAISDFAEVNISYFYNQIKNLQVSVFDGGVGFNVTNAAEAVTQGVEIDWRAAITEKLMITGSVGWLDFEFKDYQDGVCTASDRIILGNPQTDEIIETVIPGETVFDNITVRELIDGNCTKTSSFGNGNLFTADLSGSTNQYVSSYSGALSINYEDVLADKYLLRGTFDTNFTGSYHPTQNLDPLAKQEGYEIYNLRVSLTSLDDNWEVALIGRNIFDEAVISYAGDVPLSSSQFGTLTKYGFVQRTKSWALQAKYSF
ncbi:MAG: TonB-dependent receptor [Pseudomonadales bacterium]|nr:TonB-dependent receptor [Pseudomonadales bacterium]